jgi:hypothetical protein
MTRQIFVKDNGVQGTFSGERSVIWIGCHVIFPTLGGGQQMMTRSEGANRNARLSFIAINLRPGLMDEACYEGDLMAGPVPLSISVAKPLPFSLLSYLPFAHVAGCVPLPSVNQKL